MYVAKVKLENIRGFHDARKVDLDLTRPDGSHAGWTVVVGPNGSGQTTILRAIALAIAGPLVAPTLLAETTSWVTPGRAQGGIEVDLVASAEDVFARGFEPPEENVFADLVLRDGEIAAESNIGRNGPWQDSPTGWFCAAYGAFRRPGTSGGGSRQVSRLAGLFRTESTLAETVPPPLREIALALISDGLLPEGYAVSFDDSGAVVVDQGPERLPLREVGEGYRSVVCLVLDLLRQIQSAFGSVAAQEDRPAVTAPGVVLIDEVEAHLHLSWQQWIGGWLKAHFPRVQFIVTTNSPYVCQAADPRGLIVLPDPQEFVAPRVVDGDLYRRVIYGSGEDVALSELFGLDSPYAIPARRLRQELVDLEIKVLDGQAGSVQLQRYAELQELLVSSPAARAAEIAARLQREKTRRGLR